MGDICAEIENISKQYEKEVGPNLLDRIDFAYQNGLLDGVLDGGKKARPKASASSSRQEEDLGELRPPPMNLASEFKNIANMSLEEFVLIFYYYYPSHCSLIFPSKQLS